MAEQQTETTTAVTVTPPSAVELIKQAGGTMKGLKPTQVQTILEAMKPQMEAALPAHLTADRMIQMAATLIARNPMIAECTAQSLMGAVLQASLLGFRPVQALGECYFVPYNNKVKGTNGQPDQWRKEVQFQIGYKGWMNLARKNRRVKSIYAYPVYQGDEFDYALGLAPKLHHVPKHTSEDVTHAYAVARLEGSDPVFVVLTKSEIERLRLRNRSQTGKDGSNGPKDAWRSDYPAMACAKAIKQLVKWIPLGDDGDEMRKAAALDDAIIGRNVAVDDSIDAEFFVDDISYPEPEKPEIKDATFTDTDEAADALFGSPANAPTDENGRVIAKGRKAS